MFAHRAGLLLLTLPFATWTGKVDEEYQAWAARAFDGSHKSLEAGQAIACAFCNIAINAVQKQMQLNRGRPRSDRFGEDEVLEALLTLCARTAPRVARLAQGYAKDAGMLCKRVVREHVEDMIDAVSLNEDVDMFCREGMMCPDFEGFKHLMAVEKMEPNGEL
uniref:Saposin B-type domain-containing protein n=1 Tax=Noctiluca scintillans TaxID=2966 RepID=A0A7S0ZMG0_NOCSC|mmetsp:Transcript_11097/g.30656  ORF Transcript_11097/g.30656 Transcript_11097/m.30656 type:complete len:163 (-) Transcript_11097:86-574(-)